ncbi:helix-turn-helix transcriptional regulator [Clostridium saudiense]|nr:helix-turn-helix transcriptional regulator [Clostridium saudiense]
MIPRKEYILKLIEAKGWSLNQFASKAGVSSATVCRWVNGTRGAGAELIGGILRVFPEENIKKLFIY